MGQNKEKPVNDHSDQLKQISFLNKKNIYILGVCNPEVVVGWLLPFLIVFFND